MSLIAEALRRAQELKVSKEESGGQNGICDDILLGSEIVVGTASNKISLSKNRFTIVGFLIVLIVVAVLYNSFLFRQPSILKGEVPPNGTPPTAISTKKGEPLPEELTTLDTPHESAGSKPEEILTAKLSPRLDQDERAPDHLTPRKSPPKWQKKNRSASAGGTSGRRSSMPLTKKQESSPDGTRIYPDLGASGQTANHRPTAWPAYGRANESEEQGLPYALQESTSPRKSPRPGRDSYRIASAPLEVGSDKSISEQNHNNVGVTYYLRGDLEQALEQFKTAIQLNPNKIESYVNLGIVYKKQNKFHHALKAYEKALSLKPTSPDPYYNLAILYDDTRDFTRAAKAYKRFLDLTKEKHHPQKEKVQERLNLLQMYIK